MSQAFGTIVSAPAKYVTPLFGTSASTGGTSVTLDPPAVPGKYLAFITAIVDETGASPEFIGIELRKSLSGGGSSPIASTQIWTVGVNGRSQSAVALGAVDLAAGDGLFVLLQSTASNYGSVSVQVALIA